MDDIQNDFGFKIFPEAIEIMKKANEMPNQKKPRYAASSSSEYVSA